MMCLLKPKSVNVHKIVAFKLMIDVDEGYESCFNIPHIMDGRTFKVGRVYKHVSRVSSDFRKFSANVGFHGTLCLAELADLIENRGEWDLRSGRKFAIVCVELMKNIHVESDDSTWFRHGVRGDYMNILHEVSDEH